MRATSRPGAGRETAAPRWPSTSAAMAAGEPGYQLPATAALRIGSIPDPVRRRATNGRRRSCRRLSGYPVVDLGEDVVALLELPEDRLLQEPAGREHPIEIVDSGHVVGGALVCVFHGGVRLHDEGPVPAVG